MRECPNCKSCYPDTVVSCPADDQATFHSISGDPILEGKYRLERRIGQGGMGVVYYARHVYIKTQHAIKIILPDLVGNDPQLVTRFRQEALAAAAIRHQNVIAVTDFGVVNDTMPFLVMEYVEGESLHDLLGRERRLSPERALDLMYAVCAGVGAAHRQGIVHRDLKPLNIMILRDRPKLAEAVKILDFGLAKIKSGELLGSFVQAQTTGLMGSPYYMAPEQWADEDPDAAADVYSLGVMLYQMLTGDVPFKGSSIPAIMKKHLSDPPPAFSERGTDLPREIEQAVRHSLEKDRERRTLSAQALIDELHEAIGGSMNSFQATQMEAPSSSVHILTRPPMSKVFVDDAPVGQSQDDGWFMIEALRSGNHKIVVSKEGFGEWRGQIVCDGKPQQILAELPSPEGAVDITGDALQNSRGGMVSNTSPRLPQTTFRESSPEILQEQATIIARPIPIADEKKSSRGLIMGIAGALALLVIGAGGFGIWNWMGAGGIGTGGISNANVRQTNSSAGAGATAPNRSDIVKITGGKFLMGRNEGSPPEQPAHLVEVNTFWMDKTEVTNAEYEMFVGETGHQPPAHWAEGKPIRGEENFPVVRVVLSDAEEFAKWRSQRDGVEYRLPTEEEWEYAARNGEQNSLFPWGDKWETDRAVIGAKSVASVGSVARGANRWGVQDLIGNVWEWTASELKPYPNSKYELKQGTESERVIRGGSFTSEAQGENAISSATRRWVPADKFDDRLGFRLVRSN